MIRNIVCVFLIACSFAFADYLPLSGPWWSAEGMEGEAELILVDVQVPEGGDHVSTDWTSITFKIGSKEGAAGLQSHKEKFYNSHFSIQGIEQKYFDSSWVPGQWYSTLVRKWSLGNEETHLGFWIFDHTKKQWKHYGTITVPEKNAPLSGGNVGFVKNFQPDDGWGDRTGNFRRPWKLTLDGKWVKPTRYVAYADKEGKEGWDAGAPAWDMIYLKACGMNVANSPILEFEYSNINQKSTLAEKPGEIDSVFMVYNKATNKLDVHWNYNPELPPQLSYKLRVSSMIRDWTFTSENLNPAAREFSVTLPGDFYAFTGFYAEVEGVDLFNQKVKAKSAQYYVGSDKESLPQPKNLGKIPVDTLIRSNPNSSKDTVFIYTVRGEKLNTQELSWKGLKVDLKKLKKVNGSYLLKIKTSQDSVYYQSISTDKILVPDEETEGR